MRHLGPRDFVEGPFAVLPGTHVGSMLFPEVSRQSGHTAVKYVRVLQRLVAVVVLRVHAHHGGFDPQVDVLGDEDDAAAALVVLERESLGKDRIVGALARQPLRQGVGMLARLKVQSAGGRLLAVVARVAARQLQAAVDLFFRDTAHHLIEKATHLAHIACRLR